MYVIGTAGHVDHGKSTLVHALTGIDPDRLAEEKARGMTIELGFAWLRLPGGEEAGVVDVPGHERFIKNMLMGVGGIDLALLIVAADEGVMQQTREHLAILDLLEVRHGVAVITKRDLVDDDWLALVTADVQAVLKGTALEGAPVVAVSAVKRQGLDGLLRAIEKVLTGVPAKRDLGRPRLPVDRAFAISGFGAVVTGTLIEGRLRPGEEVEVLPGGAKARVRGVQTHRKPVDEAVPGTRVAVNLSGIEHQLINRGDVVTAPGWLKPSDVFDASVRALRDAPRVLRHNHQVSVHMMTAEAEATLRLLGAEKLAPGESGPAQLRLSAPLAMVRGDRFILRDTETTLGGGIVLDTAAIRHRRFHAPTLSRLKMLEAGTPDEALQGALAKLEPATVRDLARAANLPEAEAAKLLDGMVAAGHAIGLGPSGTALHYSLDGWRKVEAKAKDALAGYHQAFPLRAGIPKEDLRNRLNMRAAAFVPALAALHQAGAVVADDASVRLPGHSPKLSPEQERAAAGYLARLASNAYSPPTDSPVDPEVLQVLVEQGKVVKVNEEVVFLKPALDEMTSRVVSHAKLHGQVTIQDVRDMFGTSRKYTLALFDHTDRLQITRRAGDTRVLR